MNLIIKNYSSLLILFILSIACTPDNSTSTDQRDSTTDSSKIEVSKEAATSNHETKIADIEKQFNLIESASEYTVEKRRYTSEGGAGNYVQVDFEVYYKTKDYPLKLTVIGGEEVIRVVTSYYFQDGNLILEHNVEEEMEVGPYYENKIYYHNNEVLKAVEKKTAKGTTFAEANFQISSSFVKNKKVFEQNQQKGYLQYMSYLEKSEPIEN